MLSRLVLRRNECGAGECACGSICAQYGDAVASDVRDRPTLVN
jgi:hypothetical protein